jgi:hypothetical protein
MDVQPFTPNASERIYARGDHRCRELKSRIPRLAVAALGLALGVAAALGVVPPTAGVAVAGSGKMKIARSGRCCCWR